MNRRELFNDGWRFHRGDIEVKEPHYKGASYMQAKTERMLMGPAAYAYNDLPNDYRMSALYTDERWEEVTLPHDYVIHQTPDASHNDGLGYFLYENAWYRKHFTLCEEDKNKRIAIRFGSVTTGCEVYCNGTPVGGNDTGNTSFEIDLTDFVWFDRENVIAVHVLSAPHESWWYEGAGICRDVYLVKTELVYVVENGIHVTYEKMDSATWAIRVETEIENDSLSAVAATVQNEIIDADDTVVLTLSCSANVDSYAKNVTVVDGILINPKIWDIDMPNLYTVRSVVSVNGKPLDEDTVRTGFRTFAAKVDGFYLNGRKVPILGMNCHEDAGLFGHAIPDNLPKYKLALLKDMGCNAYRCSHYMQSDAMMDALDEMGFIVLAETRLYNSSPSGIRALETLVRRDRNRPSVFFWSLGNEEPRHRSELGVRMIRRMNAVLRRLDDTRLTTSAFCAKTKDAPVMAEVDVIGINYNHEDYDVCRALYPDKPFIGTEICATSTTRGWYQDDSPERGYFSAYDKDTNGLFISREKMMKFLGARDDVMGFYQWDGFEHRGETQWPRLCSQAGAIDLFLQRKEAFYQNKSHYVTDPFLYVMPHWNLAVAEGAPVRVRAYTNQSAAECFVNGKSFGRLVLERYASAEWSVPYDRNAEVRVVAYDGEKVVAEKTVKRTGAPVSLALTVDLPVTKANARDVVLLSCRALDVDGNVVPDACPTVAFSANKLGRVIATGSDVCDHVSVDSPIRKMRAGVISVAVRVKDIPGDLVVYAESDGLGGTSVSIPLLPVKE